MIHSSTWKKTFTCLESSNSQRYKTRSLLQQHTQVQSKLLLQGQFMVFFLFKIKVKLCEICGVNHVTGFGSSSKPNLPKNVYIINLHDSHLLTKETSEWLYCSWEQTQSDKHRWQVETRQKIISSKIELRVWLFMGRTVFGPTRV